MRAFAYERAASVDDAVERRSHDGRPTSPKADLDGGVRFLAGGTDLLTLMKGDIVSPAAVIDIKRATDLPRGIAPASGGGGGLTIGALTTLSEIEHHSTIAGEYSALAQAVAQAATPQLRNMATIGGNLLQRPRCWYYRSSLFRCWLRGGTECHARDGENQHHAILGESPCVAVHPSDAASALMALGATVRLRGRAGERMLAMDDLYAEPTEQRRTETTVEPADLLLDIHLPKPAPGSHSVYLKAMDRKVWAFALVGVAAVVRMEGVRIADARVVLSGVAPTPWPATAVEAALAGRDATPEVLSEAADAALASAHPLEHNGYKVPLARNLIRRALADATGL
jgi:xanthine dehydrogenase YagS FAD-binding subunit